MKTSKFNRTLVIGDIHGAYRALKQCLDRSAFDMDKDRLICLGDVTDGWSETVEAIEKLMEIKNLIYIIGNHDEWLIKYLKFGETPVIWTSQGGQASINSYHRLPDDIRLKVMEMHLRFFNNGVYYFVDEENRIFVHGGFDWHKPIECTSNYDLTWDRHLFQTAGYWNKMKNDTDFSIKDYKEVFVGHTTTSHYDTSLKPVNFSNVWNLDQGAGYEGKLTVMDIKSKEYWQSDIVSMLYPEEEGRN